MTGNGADYGQPMSDGGRVQQQSAAVFSGQVKPRPQSSANGDTKPERKRPFPIRISFNVSEELGDALGRAADGGILTVSQYLRFALYRTLVQDGYIQRKS
jgi:hypothetical protein